jgi:hypothetical protein
MYHKTLELLNKGVAVDEARRQLREADREPIFCNDLQNAARR